MNKNNYSPDNAEAAMLAVLVDDVVITAQTTGHGQVNFHGYTIMADRSSHNVQLKIKCNDTLIAKMDARL
jgi:hypothetical protein